MFYGMERWPGGWDLFCSEPCFAKEYSAEHPTRFATITDYYETLDPHGLGLPAPYMGGKHCFTCGATLFPVPNSTKPPEGQTETNRSHDRGSGG